MHIVAGACGSPRNCGCRGDPTATTLLERDRELAEFDTALSEARRGHGQVVLVEAPAGLGKTSLLRAASEAAAGAGFTCLRARATELERDFAYGCVRQLLEPAIASLPVADRERVFEGAAVLSEPLLAPPGDPHSMPSGDGSFAMPHGLYCLRGLADRLDAFCGTLSIDSPRGGPTSIRAQVPLAPQRPSKAA
jgi:AAA ATPase domain